MADALFERITGYREVDQIPLQISLVIPADTLVGTSATPGQIAGSVVPALIARELALRGTAQQTAAVHRLFTDPCTGTVQSIDSRSRTFDGALREFILARDQVCRTPYCEAPIRHIDHVQPHAKGAPTTALNGPGLCERCNYVKESPGLEARHHRPGGWNDSHRHHYDTHWTPIEVRRRRYSTSHLLLAHDRNPVESSPLSKSFWEAHCYRPRDHRMK